jgi:hypothetical protein
MRTHVVNDGVRRYYNNDRLQPPTHKGTEPMIRGNNRRYKNRALRRTANIGPGGDNRITMRTPVVPTIGKPSTSHCTITLDGPVTVTGLPAYHDNASPAHTVSAIHQTAPNVVVLDFTGNCSTTLTIPFEDPCLRNQAGGYVQPGTYTFPT